MVSLQGDTKAINHGTVTSTLVLHALDVKAGLGRHETAEDRRDLWEASDVIIDDLASRLLVLNVPAEGCGLGEAGQRRRRPCYGPVGRRLLAGRTRWSAREPGSA